MKTSIIKTTMQGALYLLMAIFLTSCGGGQQQVNQDQVAADTVYPEAKLTREIKDRLYELPSPIEITRMLNNAKAGYIFDITNSPGKLVNYQTEKRKAMALGIYSADLAYSASFHMIDETSKFMGCTRALADELGITGVYDSGMIERVKRAGENKDSLVALANKTLAQTNQFLAKNNRHFLALLVATGAFAEGFYLTCELNAMAGDNTKITAIILQQKEILNSLLTVYDAFSECNETQMVAGELRRLLPVFSDYGLEPGKRLARSQALKISDLAEAVRMKIVN